MDLIFSQLTMTLPYPVRVKSKLSQLHSEIINYAIKTYDGSAKYRVSIINLMNTISDMILSGDTLSAIWSADKPFENIELRDNLELSDRLGDLHINWRLIEWDIESVADDNNAVSNVSIEKSASDKIIRPLTSTAEPTPKEALYIQPPIYPQFDFNKPWLNVNHKGTQYTIFTTLPIIPETQSQISVTTNVDYMTHQDLTKLFPNTVIHTRAQSMYEAIEGLNFDSNLGVILRICGYSDKQIIANLIEYPHFYKLQRIVDGVAQSFYSQIEIDGKLYNTLEVWDSLPDSKHIPKTSEYIKEYVVRRYLLERDSGIQHKYPMYGKLEKFLTLFMPAEMYAQYGYKDADTLAKSCVTARVEYKRSRNPIIRMVYDLP